MFRYIAPFGGYPGDPDISDARRVYHAGLAPGVTDGKGVQKKPHARRFKSAYVAPQHGPMRPRGEVGFALSGASNGQGVVFSVRSKSVRRCAARSRGRLWPLSCTKRRVQPWFVVLVDVLDELQLQVEAVDNLVAGWLTCSSRSTSR